MAKGMEVREAPEGAHQSAAIARARKVRPVERLTAEEMAQQLQPLPVPNNEEAEADNAVEQAQSATATALPRPSLVQPNLPADAAFVAQACTKSGHPELIARLLGLAATQAMVASEIERAQMISRIGSSLGVPNAAAKAIAGGMSANGFREIAFAAKADADEAIVTSTSFSTLQRAAPGGSKLNADAIYDRLNKAGGQR